MRGLQVLTVAIAARLARRSCLAAHACMAVAVAATVAAIGIDALSAQSGTATFAPRDELPEEFPAGPGRDDTFYACTPCHNFKLVAQQGMSRRQWDESIELMISKHNMPEISDKDRKIVLDYLEATYPPRAPAAQGGWQNPFIKR
jgi:hypothetical protein